MSTWLYFATIARASERDTLDLVRSGYLWRSVYNSVGLAIANTRNVVPGDDIVLLYQSVGIEILRVLHPGKSRIADFPAAGIFPDAFDGYMRSMNYQPDAHLGKFTGFMVETGGNEELAGLLGKRFAQKSRNALQLFDPSSLDLSAVQGARKSVTGLVSEFGSQIKYSENKDDVKLPRQETLFLGVDVGYARKRESLGYCLLHVGPEGLQPLMKLGNVRGQGLKTLVEFEERTLPEILSHPDAKNLATIALDGPMMPRELGGDDFYRPQERVMLQGVFPTRIRAQACSSGIGNALTEATSRLRRVCERHGFSYQPFSSIESGKKGAVLEAFPKVFLATMFDPTHIDSNLNRFGTERFAADWAMASWLFQGLPEGFRGTIENPMKRLSDIRLHVPTDALGIEYIFSNKDVTAAYISALSGGTGLFRMCIGVRVRQAWFVSASGFMAVA